MGAVRVATPSWAAARSRASAATDLAAARRVGKSIADLPFISRRARIIART